ncbi:MAG: UDP-glucose 4-epimerase, partial [Candidatus Aenigmatarchaeota archaeon]
NLQILKNYNNFRFVKGDILNGSLLDSLCDNVEIIYHEAAVAGVRASIKNPVKYFEINVLGTLHILETARKKSVKKVVYASSSSVYGNVPKEDLPLNESIPTRPISPYGLSKLQGEELCNLYSNIYGLKTVCLRYFTVYGPRQRPDEAITKFIIRILKDEHIEIYGDGNQTRDFTYISDIISGTILAAEKGEGVYNLGSGKSITINELVEVISKIVGKKPKVIHVAKQIGDVEHTLADITKAETELGYKPKMSLEDGVRNHVEWCIENV